MAAGGPVSLKSDNASPEVAAWAVSILNTPTKIVTADIMAGTFSNFPDGAGLDPQISEALPIRSSPLFRRCPIGTAGDCSTAG